jgi:uncharacterized protein YndB with AHSA1/START domain
MSNNKWDVVIRKPALLANPLERVFDLITTAALWPHWIPITRAVSGVSEIPFQKGDMIYEHARTPNGPYEFQWKIVEHNRPHGAKMVSQDGTSVTYTFEEKADGIHFRRAIELGSDMGSADLFSWNYEGYSLENLKALVEKIIWRWEKGPKLKVPYSQ